MIFRKIFLALFALSTALPAFAQSPAEQEFTEKTELLSEVTAPLSPAEAGALMRQADRKDRLPVIAAGLIIMAGAKAWNVIINGRPAADLASAYASAIPGFQYNWDEVTGWQKVTRKYRFTMENFIQGRAVDIVYEVSFLHGPIAIPGSVRKGRYIANFMVKPEAIDLKWGWKVSLEALMSHPMNIGASDSPVAALTADLKWQYVKPFSTEPKIGVNSVSVDGNGNLEEHSYNDLAIEPVPVGDERQDVPVVSWN